MFPSITLKTLSAIGSLPLFSFRYRDNPTDQHRSMVIVYSEDEHECIVFADSELPKSSTYEVRADGIWADVNEEVRGEHWSFSLESFALRVPVDEYLSFRETPDTLLIGDRIPFGYEIDATSNDGENWILSGEILVEKNEIEVPNLPIRLTFK